MLKLRPDPTFKWPVKFADVHGEQTLTFIYKHMPKDEYAAYWDEAVKHNAEMVAAKEAHEAAVKAAKEDGTELPQEPEPKKTVIDEILEVVVGWEGVDAEFNREALQALLNNYHGLTPTEIFRGWIAGLTQRKLEN